MESSQEKSLPASERKLQKAREDGQGARSRDLSHLAILGAGAACMLLLAPQLMDRMQWAMSQQLAFNAATVMAPERHSIRSHHCRRAAMSSMNGNTVASTRAA